MKRFSTIMTQLLQLFPRNEFYEEVKNTHAANISALKVFSILREVYSKTALAV